MTNIFEKVKSVLFGHTVADALGVPVEFASREELRNAPLTEMEGFGTYPYPAGCWSDDTSMAIATLDSLASGKVDFEDMMIKFGDWYLNGAYTPTGVTFDIGISCASAINCFLTRALQPTKCGGNGERSNGNGSLMRIYPFVLFAIAKKMSAEECAKLCEEASMLTHAHERSKIGCGIYAFLLMRLIEKPEKSSVFAALAEAEKYYTGRDQFSHYQRIFKSDFEKLPEEEIKSSGYVVDTLEAAIWCLLNTDNYRDCALLAVNLGEDTDTVGAVAGSLAGALYGCDDIPKEWLEVIKRKEYLEELAVNAARAWDN